MKKWLEAFSIFIWGGLIITLDFVFVGFKIHHNVYKAQKFRGEFEKHTVTIIEFFGACGEDDTSFVFFEIGNKRKRVNVDHEEIRYDDKVGELIDVWCYSDLGECFFAKEGEQQVNFPKHFTHFKKTELNLFMSLVFIPIILLILRYKL